MTGGAYVGRHEACPYGGGSEGKGRASGRGGPGQAQGLPLQRRV